MVALIIVQVFLAGAGIFRLYNIKHSDDCNKSGAHCVANSTTLDPHRALGFIITEPLALLFLITALLAWFPNTRIRTISIVAPILTFIQAPLAWIGSWVGGLHPLNAFLILVMYGFLARTLFRHPQEAVATQPAAVGATAT
jgi:hypothetical protein